MPYIKQEDRTMFTGIDSPGKLNWYITRLCQGYLDRTDKGRNYTTFNEVIGVLECAKLELYRKQISPYEDKKCEENGDVYE